MEKRTMGALMSALRKSKGMTQQDVADKLGVSNKAVSKWECDDGYPDISILPAIAEIYGVTVDELLRGEIRNEEKEEKNFAPEKGIKQVEALLANASMKFKNISMIAVVLSVLSFVLAILLQLILSYFVYSTIAVILALIPIISIIAISVILEWYAANKFIFALSGEDAHKCEDKLYGYYKMLRNHVTAVTTMSFLAFSVTTAIFIGKYSGLAMISVLAAIMISLIISLLVYLVFGSKLFKGLESEKVKKTLAYNKQTGKRIVIGILCIAIGLSSALVLIASVGNTVKYVFGDEEAFDAFEGYANGKEPIAYVDYETLTLTYVDDFLITVPVSILHPSMEETMPLWEEEEDNSSQTSTDEIWNEIFEEEIDRGDETIEFSLDEHTFDSREELDAYIEEYCVSTEFFKVVPINVLENRRNITYINRETLTVKVQVAWINDIIPLIAIAVAAACVIFTVVYSAVRAKKREKAN